jgi:GDP-L-fucose synthase
MRERSARIYVAGHRGMVGSAIVRQLLAQGYAAEQIITCARDKLDLTNQADVRVFFNETKPSQVYLAAAKVGGIYANNTFPAEFIFENLMIETNIIDSAFRAGVKKLLFLGSSCIYPRLAPQPMREDALLTGPLEPTNEPYAIAKIAGIKLCESYNRQYGETHGVDFRSIMPTNLYGPGDNYHPENSHVIPALIRRFHEAKTRNSPDVVVWGTGRPRREFLFVDDLAAASLHLMNLPRAVYQAHTNCMQSHVNVGSGEDISIRELAGMVASVVGYDGRVRFDKEKPDGAPRKLMDSGIIRAFGWRPEIGLKEGLERAYREFLSREVTMRSDTAEGTDE